LSELLAEGDGSIATWIPADWAGDPVSSRRGRQPARIALARAAKADGRVDLVVVDGQVVADQITIILGVEDGLSRAPYRRTR
jgi:hypothetical protein